MFGNFDCELEMKLFMKSNKMGRIVSLLTECFYKEAVKMDVAWEEEGKISMEMGNEMK